METSCKATTLGKEFGVITRYFELKTTLILDLVDETSYLVGGKEYEAGKVRFEKK